MTKKLVNDRERPNAPHPTTQPRGDLANFSLEYEEAHNPVRSETAMWCAVITQALMDAASNSAKPEAQWDKNEARRWLLGNSEDFITVCHYAGYDPEYVQRMIKVALARNCRWRAEAKTSPPRPIPPIFTKSMSFTVAEPHPALPSPAMRERRISLATPDLIRGRLGNPVRDNSSPASGGGRVGVRAAEF